MLDCKDLNIRVKHILIIIFLCFIFTLPASSQALQIPDSVPALQHLADSTNLKPDSLVQSLKNKADSTLNKNKKSNQIDAEINYTANDSVVFYRNGTGYLHGAADITYKTINLKADFVRVSMDSSLIFARGTTDSIGQKVGEPVFSEDDKSYNSRELTYNLQTKKGFIKQAVTQEGEGYIISQNTKKTEDDVFCMTDGKYTTCDNHDHPDFYLKLTKGKVKPGQYIVAGPAYLVVQDVPLPIAVPFGFFPFTKDYSSGILMPNYADELSRGFGLTNGGYYFAISDYMDLEVRGDVYTKGTWALRGTSTYLKKYKFRGNFGIEYREDVTGEKGDKDATIAKSFKVNWTHSQDAKANPNFTFSSSVNFSTSGYTRNNINYYANPEVNSQNTKYSSVSFSKKFPDISSLSITGGMSVTQRTSDSTVILNLPNLSISYSRFYPFKRKKAVGKEHWYEKIAMSYSGTLSNSVTAKEDEVLHTNLQRDWKNGMKHSIPVSASFNLLKYINISPSFNYTERWYLQSVDKSWDNSAQTMVIDTLYGFNRVYDFNVGVSASTKLYGFFIPSRKLFGDKIDRIRHVMTPSIGFGYKPDFGDPMWGYYGTYEKIVNGVSSEVQYSHYEGSLYGTPGTGKSGSINFSLGNNVEMKVRNDNDTTGTNAFKKISLIDNFSVSGNYNLAADSMNWSNFAVSLRLKLTKSYSLSLSTSFDPYMYGYNSSGKPIRINELRWNHGQFPSFQGTSTSYSYTLNNDTFKKLFGKKENEGGKPGNSNDGQPGDNNTPPEGNNPQDNNGSPQDQNKENEKSKTQYLEDGYEKVNIPWSISINYSIRYGKTSEFDDKRMDYKLDFTHNLSLSGNISLTKNWKISANSTYDFPSKSFTYTSINVNRNLHCWSMSASIVPFGVYKSYSFHIGVNSSMLADLKYDKQSERTSVVTWY
ncbi:MAG: putative LPS assembly protein LptD [Paludibacter sp.]|nr:putative LPS assembly protein LptD [Paludibacter sp.]